MVATTDRLHNPKEELPNNKKKKRSDRERERERSTRKSDGKTWNKVSNAKQKKEEETEALPNTANTRLSSFPFMLEQKFL